MAAEGEGSLEPQARIHAGVVPSQLSNLRELLSSSCNQTHPHRAGVWKPLRENYPYDEQSENSDRSHQPAKEINKHSQLSTLGFKVSKGVGNENESVSEYATDRGARTKF